MATITISREIGSDGEAIARGLAAKMKYRFVAKDTLENVLYQYGFIGFDEVYQSAPSLWARAGSSNLELVSMLNKAILGIARLDNAVILGRGGYAALRSYANVFNVRIQAPFSTRAKCIMARKNLEKIAKAEKLVTENDKARATFVQGFYDADFYDARQFHLVLDTSLIPVDTAIEWIAEAAQLLVNRLPVDSLTTQDIVVDQVLADAINQVLATVSD